MSFKTGNTYIVEAKSKFYVVQQVSQRTWVATVFSHTTTPRRATNVHLSGNGVVLYSKFEDLDSGFVTRAYRIDSQLRKDMFNILSYGRFISG